MLQIIMFVSLVLGISGIIVDIIDLIPDGHYSLLCLILFCYEDCFDIVYWWYFIDIDTITMIIN